MPVCSWIEIAFLSESSEASSVASFKLHGLKRYRIPIWFWIATIDLDLLVTLSKTLMKLRVEGHDLFIILFYFCYWTKFFALFFCKNILIWKLSDHFRGKFLFSRDPNSTDTHSLIDIGVIHSAIRSLDFLISLKSRDFSRKLEVKRRQN